MTEYRVVQQRKPPDFIASSNSDQFQIFFRRQLRTLTNFKFFSLANDTYWVENNPATFHLDLLWNDEALGFFWRASLEKEEEEQQQQQQDE